jgi:hypothetical protein
LKTSASQQRRLLLIFRKLLQRMAYDIENDMLGQLHTFGLKVGVVGAAGCDAQVIVIPLLLAREALRTQLATLRKSAPRHRSCRSHMPPLHASYGRRPDGRAHLPRQRRQSAVQGQRLR